MDAHGQLDTPSATLSPLPLFLKRGLTAIVTLAFLSFVTSFGLFALLTYRLISWRRKSRKEHNQFVLLLYNLVLADIQQSIAFILNVAWVTRDGIVVGTPQCWAQGWFISTGDLASGIWIWAIGLHTFAAVVFNYRLPYRTFCISIAALWAFVYLCGVIGPVTHHNDYYVRAGAWCWVNDRYAVERLVLHYLWIFCAAFGTMIIYLAIFIILRRRIKNNFFEPLTLLQAKQAAKYMVIYPLVYTICTLPLATSRMAAMTGFHVPLRSLLAAGAMIASNGWLDVLLYTMTRTVPLFAAEPPPSEICGLDTFRTRPDQEFGTTTVIVADGGGERAVRERRSTMWSGHGSMDELVVVRGGGAKAVASPFGVKTETVVQVQSEMRDRGWLRDERSLESMSKEDGASSERRSISPARVT
ncbi:hypothetical protein LTR50_001906 [Elasticomyces elasticus]|nr:hypothetical protein LTR50_001906 [Elasticomyces elasticus]